MIRERTIPNAQPTALPDLDLTERAPLSGRRDADLRLVALPLSTTEHNSERSMPATSSPHDAAEFDAKIDSFLRPLSKDKTAIHRAPLRP
tara:strand:- start:435 stop:704 length:270 start_codon:yes stop_codon:yes gene_type:complete